MNNRKTIHDFYYSYFNNRNIQVTPLSLALYYYYNYFPPSCYLMSLLYIYLVHDRLKWSGYTHARTHCLSKWCISLFIFLRLPCLLGDEHIRTLFNHQGIFLNVSHTLSPSVRPLIVLAITSNRMHTSYMSVIKFL